MNFCLAFEIQYPVPDRSMWWKIPEVIVISGR